MTVEPLPRQREAMPCSEAMEWKQVEMEECLEEDCIRIFTRSIGAVVVFDKTPADPPVTKSIVHC